MIKKSLESKSSKSHTWAPLRRTSLRKWPIRGRCAGGMHASCDPRGILLLITKSSTAGTQAKAV
jgi:hypothetical protein